MRTFHSTFFLLLAVLCCTVAGRAASLEDYSQRVTRAAFIADDLYKTGRNDAASVDELRRLLPARENVEWRGGSVETDNRWLSSDLDAFVAGTGTAKRRTRMGGIFDRLNAIARQISELKSAEAAGATKDENKQKIGEILRRPEYQKAEPPGESLFQKWYRAFMEWLEKVFPGPVAPSEPSAPTLGSLRLVLQILIFAAIIALVAFLIYRFGPAAGHRFGWRQKEKRTDRVILGERIAADETGENLFGEAEKLAGEGRLREAIRKGYIAALCELSDRRIVRLARHKTNRDYLRDVRKTRGAIFDNMAGLTGSYEQNWYGLRASDAADWEDFRVRYRETIEKMYSAL